MDDSITTGNPRTAVLSQLLGSRYSCRAYRPDPVPREIIERVFSLAQRTPSWCNTQPWQVVVVSGDALESLTTRLYDLGAAGEPIRPDFPFPEAYEDAYRDRRKVCGVQLYQSLGIGRDDREQARLQALENHRGFGAPHAAFITTPERLGPYGAVDCGLYVMSLMLLLQAEGVACIAQAALASYPDVVRETLGFAPDRRMVCGLSFGYAQSDAPINGYRTERASLADAVRFVDHG
ncbi:MAG: nitroreductase [Burkholderiales bacterium]